MANATISKTPKWFSKLKLTPRRHRKPNTTATKPPSAHTKENELGQVFRYFDGDKDGKISSLELKSWFESIGEKISEEEAREVIRDLDSDGDGLLDVEDFKRLMTERDSAEEEELRRAFEMFEAEKGSGCITPKSLQRALSRLGDAKSFEECATMIRAFDLDRNGVVDFHEFHRMMA